MLKFIAKGKVGTYDINLPTSINEITESYIYDVTKQVKIAPNYSLIGLIFKEKASNIALAIRKNNKKADIAVVPIFVKAGESDSNFINNLKIRQKLIVASSDIMRGYHVSTPDNQLTLNNLMTIMSGDINANNTLIMSDEYCYFIEFKLIPNCDIHGAYDVYPNENIINPFITKISEDTNTASKIIV